MGPTVLDVLRRAGAALTLPAVVRFAGWTRPLCERRWKGSAGRALWHQRSLGTVRNPQKEGRPAPWELAE